MIKFGGLVVAVAHGARLMLGCRAPALVFRVPAHVPFWSTSMGGECKECFHGKVSNRLLLLS